MQEMYKMLDEDTTEHLDCNFIKTALVRFYNHDLSMSINVFIYVFHDKYFKIAVYI